MKHHANQESGVKAAYVSSSATQIISYPIPKSHITSASFFFFCFLTDTPHLSLPFHTQILMHSRTRTCSSYLPHIKLLLITLDLFSRFYPSTYFLPLYASSNLQLVCYSSPSRATSHSFPYHHHRRQPISPFSRSTMAAMQTMTSNSFFSSPFHEPPNNPEALGSYTSCEGPPARPRTSPVAKIRKQIASTFAPKDPKDYAVFLDSKPFESDILIFDFVPETKSPPKRARSAPPPPERKTPEPRVTSNILEPCAPLEPNIVSIPFVPETFTKQPKSDRKLRHFSSCAAIADAGPSASTMHLVEDDMSTQYTTPTNSRPGTAAGADAAQSEAKDSDCPCGCLECQFATTNLCKCTCTCKDCHCRSRNLSKRILKLWKHHARSTTRQEY